MTIEFKIPNGNMKINADTFFQEAPRAKIRKMLKWFMDSGPDPEAVQELKGWLQGEIQNEKDKAWECPNCHWDSTSDDMMENARITDYSGGFYDWECTAHWTCPVCGCKFETWESN